MFEAPIIRAIGSAGLSVVLVALAVALTLVPALCALGARRLLREAPSGARDTASSPASPTWVHRSPRAHHHRRRWPCSSSWRCPPLGLRLTSSGAELLPSDARSGSSSTDLARGLPPLAGAEVRVVATAARRRAAGVCRRAFPTGRAESVDGRSTTLSDGLSTVGFRLPGGRLATEDAREPWSTPRARPAAVRHQGGRARPPGCSRLHRLDAERALLGVRPGGAGDAGAALPHDRLGRHPGQGPAAQRPLARRRLGVVVWIFQEGHLEGLLQLHLGRRRRVDRPFLVLAFGFGLSMDYEVFLLSRIVELHVRGYENDRAVSLGLQRTGRIITSAALLIVIVFSGFVAGDILIIKQMGVALVAAVLIDATLVRMLLVPATMSLLGRWNWWAPAPLRRLHERFGITE